MSSLLVLCFRPCLRSGSTSSYYETLQIDRRADESEIRKAYRKASLNLHPDKIAQRGKEVTEEDKLLLLQVKEAYAVLVDPKRRKLYDALGETGLRLFEDPSSMMKPETQAEVISNFQANHRDRCALISLIMLLYFAIAIFPILFSLKCDGYLPAAPWAALWTPLWVVDVIIMASAILDFFTADTTQDAEGNDVPEPTSASEYLDKTLTLLQTASFVLIQVFLVARLDRGINWSWYSVFAPWFAYEALQVLALFYESCLFEVPPPDFSSKATDENEHHEGEEDEEDKRLEIEMQYYFAITKQQQGRSTIVSSLLRIWLAVFLAYKLNSITDTPAAQGANWSWGLVLLPVWLFVLSRYYYAFLSYYKSRQVIQSLQGQDLEDPGVRGRIMYGQNLSMSCFFTGCCTAVPILMSVLLVCSLEIKPISTFIVILPVFIALFLLLMCICTVWCCFATMDVTLDEEGQSDDKASGYVPPPEDMCQPDMVTSPVIFIPDEAGPTGGIVQQQQQQQPQPQPPPPPALRQPEAATLSRPPPTPVDTNENPHLALNLEHDFVIDDDDDDVGGGANAEVEEDESDAFEEASSDDEGEGEQEQEQDTTEQVLQKPALKTYINTDID